MSHVDSTTRARTGRFRLDLHTAVDTLMVLALGTVALSALATSFTGWSFLVIGVVGLVIGALITHLVRALGWPWISAAVMALAVFFLLGGPLCLRSLGDASVLPSGATLEAVADQALFGWKDLLTTLPPVDGDGPLLVLPWLLGLVGGLVGTALAHLTLRRAWLGALLPVVVMTGLLVGAILLGVHHPASLALQGAVFAALALGWLGLRTLRFSAIVRGGSGGWGRAGAGIALVGLAAGVALPASALIGDDDTGRTVARNWIEPPFDVGRYPSPLAGFRKYVDLQGRKDPANVHDKTLLTVSGLEAGSRMRFATMDHYDGMVWGASNDSLPGEAGGSFQRVSSVIDNPVPGDEVQVEVTIGEGFTGPWLPTSGALQSVEFGIGDPLVKQDVFRYNLATSAAIVPAGLHPGDTYSFAARTPADSLDGNTVPYSLDTTMPAGTAFLGSPATQWSEGTTKPMARVLAIAKHLKREGKYSDGVAKDERQYHPGHHLHRLSDEFVNQQVMVGNDEQYAAVMALLAKQSGVPARVVLGAVVPDDGVIEGKDVSAWVEVRAADGTWRTLATQRFMSHEPPNQQLPETNQPMTGTVIPPPAPIPPPSDLGDQSDAELKQRKTAKDEADKDDPADAGLPAWIGFVARYVGFPLLIVAAVIGSIVGVKLLRRRRRRNAATASARFVGAWRELVDHARDLGQIVPGGSTVTRREQAGDISDGAPSLARRADRFVFGPTAPVVGDAAAYWSLVDEERRVMSGAVDRRTRWLAAVSLTTFRSKSR